MVQESEHFSAPVTSPSRSRRLTAYLQAACQLATTHTRLISPAIVFQRGPKGHAVHQYLELDVVPAPPGVPRRTTPDARCNNRATPTSQQSCVARGQSSHDWRSSHPSFGSTVAPQTRKRSHKLQTTAAATTGKRTCSGTRTTQCSQHARGFPRGQCCNWLPLSPLLRISEERLRCHMNNTRSFLPRMLR